MFSAADTPLMMLRAAIITPLFSSRATITMMMPPLPLPFSSAAAFLIPFHATLLRH